MLERMSFQLANNRGVTVSANAQWYSEPVGIRLCQQQLLGGLGL
jgi:hypothetical protein